MSKLNFKNQKYLPIIGLEVHVELRTKSKMFCSCPADHFAKKPNTQTCPVCLGLPGALPVPNGKAIDWCILIGMSLNCQVNDESFFDRKNYFYPDLPKGYQISQHNRPFSTNGFLIINNKKIRINRVHMEEDTAKLIHQFESQKSKVKSQKYTLIDFNRSGVPLVEIVTEPDIDSADMAVSYLKKIQQIIRYLEVSDADMEKGSMRLEANVSILKLKTQMSNVKTKSKNSKLPDYKVEVKNINSFRYVARAINYEIARQKQVLESGKTPIQETRGYDEKLGKTYSQRSKEEAKDYRYFPEPDIPPFANLKSQISNLKSKLPELPDEKIARFIKDYKISEYNATILAATKKTAEYFEQMVKQNPKLAPASIANMIVNKKTISQPKTSVSDELIEEVIKKVLSLNPKPIADFQKGKINAIQFLVGQVMRELKGQAEPEVIREKILAQIN